MVGLCSEAAVVSRGALGSSCLAQTCKKDWAKHGVRPLSIEREGKTMVGVRMGEEHSSRKQRKTSFEIYSQQEPFRYLETGSPGLLRLEPSVEDTPGKSEINHG